MPEEAGARSAWVRPMKPRDPDEPHRSATPLELLFDLCFVVAIAQAASSLHHRIVEGHAADAVLGYVLVFFAIWWAWMNFTWFASAYDCGDTPYRLMVFVQMAGAVVLAAGVSRAFEHLDFTVVTLGYVIIRVGLVANWLRAAHADSSRRRTSLRYALGVTACQIGWVALLALPPERWVVGFLVLAPAELLVPVWAESTGPTPWNRHHIAERYGLMSLIVIGESVLATTLAIQSAIDVSAISGRLLALVAGGLVTLFSMWWLYFASPAHRALGSIRMAFLWGYGHLLIFASIAAVGAGLAVSVETVTGHAQLPGRVSGASVALPAALFVVGVWLLQIRPLAHGKRLDVAFLVTAGLLLATPTFAWTVPLVGLLLAALVATMVALAGGGPERLEPEFH